MKSLTICFSLASLLALGVLAAAETQGEAPKTVGSAYDLVMIQNSLEFSRKKRSISDEIDKRIQNFADGMNKLPEEYEKMSETILKFFKDRGITSENVEKILKDVWAAIQKLVDQIKKSFGVKNSTEATTETTEGTTTTPPQS